MQDLVYAFTQLMRRNPDGSYSTQAGRKAILLQAAAHLRAAGYKDLKVAGLKGRHVQALLKQWQADGLSAATQKNRMAALRWWAEKIGNPGAIAARNGTYGIGQRTLKARTSKAKDLPEAKLLQVRNQYVRMSLELQRAFGLRRAESIKIKPHQADRGEKLVLQGSWCKGGRAREIPIRTEAQRAILDRAKALVKRAGTSLIPSGKTYAYQMGCYEAQTRRAGLSKMHGLRHAYAEARFLELAGFPAPVAGGPAWRDLTPQQKEAAFDARVIVSEELGHAREEVVSNYLGR
jgi:site-specific recombinase XerD